MRKLVGDASVTTKGNMKLCKENKVDYIGRIKKNIKVEIFGKKTKIEALFSKDKHFKRTIEGKEFKLSSKVANLPNVGRVKIVKCLMENNKEPYFLASTNFKKKPENIVNLRFEAKLQKEYMKRFMIEEKHRGDKSLLKFEGNYLRSYLSNKGFILLMAALSNCIEYLSHKFQLSFYKIVYICSANAFKPLLS